MQHDTCPLEIREALARVDVDGVNSYLKEAGVVESMVLSTCNRYEIYGYSEEKQEKQNDFFSAKLADMAGVRASDLQHHLFHKTDESMLRHGFGVAASIHSMVVGEPQILGQMKQAWQESRSKGHTGTYLDRFANTAFKVGKRVRTETAIAAQAVSVASVAVKLSKNIYGNLGKVNALLIGAGDMCENAAQHLKSSGVGSITICNRSLSRAKDLAGRFDANIIPFQDISSAITRADMIITSTASRGYVVSKDMAAQALLSRKQQPLLFIDMAVPRDVDPLVHTLENCYVYDMDSLGKLAAKSQKKRQSSIGEAQRIINEEVNCFMRWQQARQQAVVIKSLRDNFYQIREDILAKGLNSDEATRLLVNKILHTPLSFLRDGKGDKQTVDTLKKLFDLDKI